MLDTIQSNPTLLAILTIFLAATIFLFSSSKPKPSLDPSRFQAFKLKSKTPVSPNSSIYRFSLSKPDAILGLPIGQHISIQALINGKTIQRSYTPVSSDDDRGYFDLLIKTYPQGNLSKFISTLNLGDSIQVKGPKGQMRYHPKLCTQIGMIAGGTGITPMLQIIRAAVKNPADQTKISLIYANVNHEDILMKQELDRIQLEHPEQFSVYYVLNNPPPSSQWTSGVGFVTKQMIHDQLPPPTSNSIKILLCGPPPMMSIMKKYLVEDGFEAPRTVSKMDDQVFCF